MQKRLKIVRTSTVATSLNVFCRGTLKKLSEKYDVVAVSTPGEELNEIAQREGVRTVGVPMTRPISPINDLVSLLRLVKTFLRERPDMVHSITPKAGLLSMIAAWICRVPVRMHTFTGLVFPTATGLKQRVLMLTDRITCACATHIVPEGEGVKYDLQHYGITRKPMNVLGYGNVRGVDMAHYCRTAEVMAKADGIRQSDVFTFVFVGRIVRDKGIGELVDAFSRLNKEISGTRLLLVGYYEDTDPLDDAVRQEIDNNPAIVMAGRQTDVRPWYAASDALAFPSYREGFPNVVLEAGAMGLPSIVTDINGSREIISEGENGVIVPAHDADALYEQMRRMVRDQSFTARLAANSRRMVAERFDKRFVEKCLLDYYEEVINSVFLKKITDR
ncbi:MAG: glycosyltransferase family 4 protein [Bacteroidales bacterium]|nr:glycosyltransferase family 4 protein [Bacteroidales bacterium]